MFYSSKTQQKGFSLVEIMVVLVILGLLASVVTVSVRNYLVSAKQNAAKMEIASICEGLETFYTLFDRYPSNDEGLNVLVIQHEKLAEPILKQSPIDPWGKPYEYSRPGRDSVYEVISFGADGREGGEGEDQDLTSNDLKNQS